MNVLNPKIITTQTIIPETGLKIINYSPIKMPIISVKPKNIAMTKMFPFKADEL